MPLLFGFTLGMTVFLVFLNREAETMSARRRLLWVTAVSSIFWSGWFVLLDALFFMPE